MLKKYTLIIFLTFLVVFKSQSQSQTENYPVSATLVFAAPFSLKVSDYFTSNTRMYLNLNLKDLTKPTLKVYLKWSLEGPGIRISTRDGFIPTSLIELNKGVNLQKGSDLSLYFQRGMLDYQGIDEGVVFNGSIPEGFYTMKFQALEASSGREVSNLAESFFFVTSPQPPIINQPFNGSIVPVSNPQNVLLQWTPRQISTLESQVVYEVKVYEVAKGDDPVVVANSSILPFFTITQPNTSTFIGPSNKPLLEGFRYAMVVTAIDLNKKMNFVNDGRSEVSWFQYGKGCFAPAGLDVAETAPGKVILSWTPNTTAEGYVIEYKKKTESTWIINGSTDNSFTLNGLSPRTDYEFRVKTQCSGGKYSAYTATESVSVIGLITPTPETALSLDDVLDPFSQTVSTKSDGTPFDPKNIDALFALLKPPACAISGVSYVCGQTPSATPPVGIDLTTLAKGDVLGIYDYAVLVTEVSKGSSPFTGKGLVKLPFAGGIKVPVEFKGIKAKKGEDGTHGGCVWYVPADLNEGYFQVKGSQQDAIVKEQEKLLADIYSELIDPQSFYGTFEEALAKYEAKSKEIACKFGQLPADQCVGVPAGQPTKDDYKELTKNLRGVVQGGTDWKEKLLKHLGVDAFKPEMKAILEDLDKIKADLLACEKCVADTYLKNTPAPTGKGGPTFFDFERFVIVDCQMVLGTEQKMTDIGDLMKKLLGNEKPGDIQLKLLAAIKDARSVKKTVLDLAPIIKGGIQSSWIPNTEKLDNLNHKMYPPVTNLKLPNGKTLKYLQVDADDAIWKKDQTTIPFQVGVIGLNYTERKVTKEGYTALMFKDAANANSIFWVTVKDEDVATMKEYWEGPKFPVSGEDLHKIFPNTSKARCDEVSVLLNKYSDKFKIDTDLRMSHFLGQVAIESNRLKSMGEKSGENPCYTSTNAAWNSKTKNMELYPNDTDKHKNGWIRGKKWSETPIQDGCDDYSPDKKGERKNGWNSIDDIPSKYVCSKDNPANISGKALLSYVYRCEGGNGNEASEDGYTYRGHGMLQLTWKKQYNAFNTWLTDAEQGFTNDYKQVLSKPDEAFKDKEIDVLSAMWYWKKGDCNKVADGLDTGCTQSEFDALTKKINTALLDTDKRKDYFELSYKTLKK